MKKFLSRFSYIRFVLPFLLLASSVSRQVGIGTTTPKAALDVVSSTSGVLVPRYATLAAANSNSFPTLNAADHKGLMIYVDEVANRGFWFYDGTAFAKVGAQTSPLPITNGGTGATTSGAALNALLPTQSGNAGKVLTTDGTTASWQKPASRPRSIILDLGSIDVSATQNVIPPTKSTIGSNSTPVIGFAEGVNQQIQTQIPIPADWDGITPFTVTLYYSSATTTGNFYVLVSANYLNVNSIITDPVGICSVPPTVASTTSNGLMQNTYTICVPISATSKILNLNVSRLAFYGQQDTATGFFNLLGMRIDYQD